jgi:hypothetical protein
MRVKSGRGIRGTREAGPPGGGGRDGIAAGPAPLHC